jgi:hypothetical protein
MLLLPWVIGVQMVIAVSLLLLHDICLRFGGASRAWWICVTVIPHQLLLIPFSCHLLIMLGCLLLLILLRILMLEGRVPQWYYLLSSFQWSPWFFLSDLQHHNYALLLWWWCYSSNFSKYALRRWLELYSQISVRTLTFYFRFGW